MADYYPLIARAVAGLERNTAEARRALYERARAALVAQLRGVVPALEESEITRERLALEESIRKVEAESARHSRTEIPRPPPIPRPPRANPVAKAAPPPPPPPAPPETPPPAPAADSAPPLPEAAPPSVPVAEEPPAPAVAEADIPAPPPAAEPEAPPAPPPSSAPPLGMRLTRRREAPPVELDAPPAARAARRSAADRGLKAPLDSPPGAMDLDALARVRRPAREERNAPPAAHDFDQLEPPAEARVEPEPARPARERPPRLEFEPSPQLAGSRPTPPRQRSRPPPQDTGAQEELLEEPPRARRSYRGLIKWAIALVILGTLTAGAYWQRNALGELYHAFMGPSTPVARQTPPPAAAPTNARPKISDRIGPAGQETAPSPAGRDAVAPVAQRVVLYEEDPSNPEGKRVTGNIVWRTETVSPGAGLSPELAIKGDISIPDYRITATWSIRRNLDKALPASHTIEIMFNLPPDFPGGGISNVPGILMKQAEQTRGQPLAGLAVKVTTGFFLIGLSAVEADMQRNIQLLKERAWFDIPLVYNNNRRAILALEKGTPGERAFAEAFAAWKQ